MTGPRGFDLGKYWERSQAEFDASIRTTSVPLRIPEARIADLRRAVPGRVTDHAFEHARRADGALELQLPLEPDEIAASQLITVPEVEILSPQRLQSLNSMSCCPSSIALRVRWLGGLDHCTS